LQNKKLFAKLLATLSHATGRIHGRRSKSEGKSYTDARVYTISPLVSMYNNAVVFSHSAVVFS
jgi:hypothetical protein